MSATDPPLAPLPSGTARGERFPARPPTPRRPARPGGERTGREPTAHRLYARIAWTTLDGLPLVGPRRALTVESQIIALCRRLDVEPMDARARRDRVDVLVRIKPVHGLARVAAEVKAASEAHLAGVGSPARWARGHAIVTVSPARVRDLMRRMALLRHGG